MTLPQDFLLTDIAAHKNIAFQSISLVLTSQFRIISRWNIGLARLLTWGN